MALEKKINVGLRTISNTVGVQATLSSNVAHLIFACKIWKLTQQGGAPFHQYLQGMAIETFLFVYKLIESDCRFLL